MTSGLRPLGRNPALPDIRDPQDEQIRSSSNLSIFTAPQYSLNFKVHSDHLASLKKTVEQHRQESITLCKQLESLKDQRSKVQGCLNSVVPTVQPAGSPEEEMTDQMIVGYFEQLENAIEELVQPLMKCLPQDILERPVGRELLSAAQYYERTEIGQFLKFASQYHSHIPLHYIIHVFLQYMLREQIWERVFYPFFPGMTNEHSNVFHDIHRIIQETEVQEKADRWRALTYSHLHLQMSDDTCPRLARDTLDITLSHLCSIPCLGISKSFPLDDILKRTSQVFEQAIEFQSMVQIQVTSATIQVVLTTSHRRWIKLICGRGDQTMAIIPVGMGLLKAKGGKSNSDGIQRWIYREPLVPLCYIGENWSPVAQSGR